MNEEHTRQESTWSGDFGSEYTDRNTYDPVALDAFYEAQWGVARSKMNQDFLSELPKDSRILEVGSNVGNQLRCLQSMGFSSLSGVELQDYAVEQARKLCPDMDIQQGSAFELPFEDRSFDLVFTSGVLIHISPDDLPKAVGEVYRCSGSYIWGFEYYADEPTSLPYRGKEGLLWKRDFSRYYLDVFSDLKMLMERRYPYVNEDLVDSMFLLRKRGATS